MNQKAAPQSALRTALAGLIGNVLEWFDFAVYGYFSMEIGKIFFPKHDPVATQILSFAVFGVGFLARPLGGLLLAPLGDRMGRRALMTVSIAIMGLATLGIGLLPGHATIGIAAPILLVTLRLIQGFSLGGEFTGSMAYTTEKASPLMRGFVSSSTAAGTTMGFILGSLTAWGVHNSLPAAAVAEWGWRIPFIASVILCGIGLLLRKGISESEEGLKVAGIRNPILPSIAADWRPILQTFGIIALTNAAYYLTFTFAVEQRKAMAKADPTQGDGSIFLLANTVALGAVLVAKPLGGWLSDLWGRRRLMLALTVATMALVPLALYGMLHGGPAMFIGGQLLMAFPLGMALGLQGAMLVEIFPLKNRVSSMSFAYGVTLALAGGTAPFVSTFLTAHFQNVMAPAVYVALYGVIGLLVLIPMKETNKRPLGE